MSNNRQKTYTIPQNYEDNLITSSGISIRNIIEGVILFAIIGVPLWFVPITSIKIRVILIIVLGGIAATFGIIGIHHYALSEYLMLIMRYRSSSKDVSRDTIFDDNIDKKANFSSIDEDSITDNNKNSNEGRKKYEKSKKPKQRK